jgi:hypothetical protein
MKTLAKALVYLVFAVGTALPVAGIQTGPIPDYGSCGPCDDTPGPSSDVGAAFDRYATALASRDWDEASLYIAPYSLDSNRRRVRYSAVDQQRRLERLKVHPIERACLMLGPLMSTAETHYPTYRRRMSALVCVEFQIEGQLNHARFFITVYRNGRQWLFEPLYALERPWEPPIPTVPELPRIRPAAPPMSPN